MNRAPHCKFITKVPSVATTGMQSKLNFMADVLTQTELLMRQSAWKAWFPVGGGGTTTGGTTGGGTTGGGTTGGGTTGGGLF